MEKINYGNIVTFTFANGFYIKYKFCGKDEFMFNDSTNRKYNCIFKLLGLFSKKEVISFFRANRITIKGFQDNYHTLWPAYSSPNELSQQIDIVQKAVELFNTTVTKAETIYTLDSFKKRVGGRHLKLNDIVKFEIGGKEIIYRVSNYHLHHLVDRGLNDQIFRELGMEDMSDFILECYGYPVFNSFKWPHYKNNDFRAATRAVEYLYHMIENGGFVKRGFTPAECEVQSLDYTKEVKVTVYTPAGIKLNTTRLSI